MAFETLVLARSSGVPDENARRNALAVFKAMIGNDARLVPPQPNPWRCVVCDEKGTANSPLVPVLTPNEGEHRWLHLGCHDAYCRRQAATVEALMRDAGIPTEGRPEAQGSSLRLASDGPQAGASACRYARSTPVSETSDPPETFRRERA